MLKAIRERGLTLRSNGKEEIHVQPKIATDDPSTLPPQDVVLVTVKAHALSAAAPAIGKLLAANGVAVFLLNGIPWWFFQKLDGVYAGRSLESVDPAGRLALSIAPEHIIGSVVYPAAELIEPGVVRVIEGNRFTLGELDGSRSERIEALSSRVGEVASDVASTRAGVESLGEQLSAVEGKLDDVSQKQDFANRGVYLLCSAVSQAMSKDGGSTGPSDARDASKKLAPIADKTLLEMLAAPSSSGCNESALLSSQPLLMTGTLQEQLAAISTMAAVNLNMTVGA